MINDDLYVAYDVRINGELIIPKGTRVQGDWVTETNPNFAAQLQINNIYLQQSGQRFNADSDVINTYNIYNDDELNANGYVYKTRNYKAKSNLARRIVDNKFHMRPLLDYNKNVILIEIHTVEIAVTLTVDFVAFPGDNRASICCPKYK